MSVDALASLLFEPDLKGIRKLKKQIDVLSLDPRFEAKLLRKMGSRVVKNTRQNIREQKTVEGKKMSPRVRQKKTRRKLMAKMGKGLKVKRGGRHSMVVSWHGNSLKAKIAYAHDRGIGEKFTPAKAKKVYGSPDYNAPATAKQAKALVKAGYRRRVARKRGKGGALLKKVSAKWIRDNMTIGQAALVLKLLHNDNLKGVQSWKTKPAKRPILGATAKDADAFTKDLGREVLKEIMAVS